MKSFITDLRIGEPPRKVTVYHAKKDGSRGRYLRTEPGKNFITDELSINEIHRMRSIDRLKKEAGVIKEELDDRQ